MLQIKKLTILKVETKNRKLKTRNEEMVAMV